MKKNKSVEFTCDEVGLVLSGQKTMFRQVFQPNVPDLLDCKFVTDYPVVGPDPLPIIHVVLDIIKGKNQNRIQGGRRTLKNLHI